MKAGISLTGAYVKEGMAAAIPFSYCTNWQHSCNEEIEGLNIKNTSWYDKRVLKLAGKKDYLFVYQEAHYEL